VAIERPERASTVPPAADLLLHRLVTLVGGGFPVDRRRTGIESLAGAQLPLAEEGPDECDTTDDGANDGDDGNGVTDAVRGGGGGLDDGGNGA